MAEKIDGRKTPEFSEASRKRAQKMMLHPVRRRAASCRMTALNADPDFKTAHSERTRDRMNTLYEDPTKGSERIAKAQETLKVMRKSPIYSEKLSEQSRKDIALVNADPTHKQALSERMRTLHKDPAFAAQVAERLKAGRAKLAATQFAIPKGYENFYRKLRRSIGVEEARKQLPDLIARGIATKNAT